jgi:hypothetical protein
VPAQIFGRFAMCVLALLGLPASASTSEASMFWNTFSYTTSPGVSLTWLSPITYVFAGSPAPPQKAALYAASADWTSPLEISEQSGQASAFAEASAVILHALSDATANCCEARSALGQAWREGAFQLSGHGTATFSIDYQLAVTGPAGNNFDYSTAAASLFYLNNSDRVDSLRNSINGSSTASGTLTLVFDTALSGTMGDTLIIAPAAVSTVIAVPEPSQWALLLAGCGLVSARAWRRQRITHTAALT